MIWGFFSSWECNILEKKFPNPIPNMGILDTHVTFPGIFLYAPIPNAPLECIWQRKEDERKENERKENERKENE